MINNELKKQWQTSFTKALTFIEDNLTSKENDYEDLANFRIFANWLATNEHNSYGYMPSGFKNFNSNPFEFQTVLSIVRHALLDDGEISFVTTKLEGETISMGIVFVWKNEENFREICEQENKNIIDSYIKGRETLHRAQLAMKEKKPEKETIVRPLLTKDDFTFEAHNEPLRFIEDFEAFQKYKNDKYEAIDKKMREMRSKKF